MKTNNKMRVLVVEPRKKPYVIEIEKGWKSIVTVLDCELFDSVKLDADGTTLVCDDNGIAKGLESNRIVNGNIIAGKFFVCGRQFDEDGYCYEYCSLSDKKIEEYMLQFMKC